MGEQSKRSDSMGRPRSEQREESKKRYIDSKGKIKNKKLAELVGASPSQISRWKAADRWDDYLHRKRGGQPGNRNAAGKNEKLNGNQNAKTHGAYAAIDESTLPQNTLEEIKKGGRGAYMELLDELKDLQIRKVYLEELLKEYESPEAQGKFYTDSITHTIRPKNADDIAEERDTGTKANTDDPDPSTPPEQMKTQIKIANKSSAFSRSRKISEELNRIHGRIIKALDSMKSYELESQRIELERQRLDLSRQRAIGVFDDDDEDSEEIIDSVDDAE